MKSCATLRGLAFCRGIRTLTQNHAAVWQLEDTKMSPSIISSAAGSGTASEAVHLGCFAGAGLLLAHSSHVTVLNQDTSLQVKPVYAPACNSLGISMQHHGKSA